MESKKCVFCNTEKSIDNVYNKDRECKQLYNERSLICHYENQEKVSNQQKKYFERNRDKPFQKQNIRYIIYKEIHRSYVELQNKLKSIEEKFTTNDSKNKSTVLKIEKIYTIM